MRKVSILVIALCSIFMLSNCSKHNTTSTPEATTHTALRAVYTGFPETFESGSKTAYAAGAVTLSTGSWYFTDALIGNLANDRKNGSWSVRIQNTGKITMQFNKTSGATDVSVYTALYGTDASCTWGMFYSTNSGSTWAQVGSTITTSTTTLTRTVFTLSVTGNVRFELRKLSGTGRLNVDDFSITDNSGTGGGSTTDTIPTRDSNLALGNPSGAGTSSANNYLMNKTCYSLSYNNAKGIPNWVSWHLSRAWKGSATRCDCFTQDASLPTGYYRASTSNYTSTGFDRGHMCPSDDRDGSSSDNAQTFLMTNITPQAPNMNQITWEALEAYCRNLIYQGNELYIIAGQYGTGGTGSAGSRSTIASGNITVPARFWKVIVVLPNGVNDVSRVSTSTRIIAVDMPNTQTVNSRPWSYYRTTVDAIESATGYDLLNAVSTTIQSTIEARTDTVTIR